MTQATRPQTAKILATRFTTIDKPDTPLAATMTAVRLPQHVHDLIAQYLPDGAKKAAWLREVIGSAAIAQFKPVETEPQAAKVDHSDLERAILYLDSRCDGCETEDGRGFNGCDTNFGKWLAGKLRIGESLLQSHAVKALKMLQKYKNTQLIPAGFVLPKWEDIADRYPEANVIKREINGEVCTPKRLIQLKGESLAMFAPYDVTQKLQQRARELKGRFFRRDQGGDDSWRFELELEKIEQVLQQWPEPMYTHDPAIEGVLAALKADRDAEIAEQEAAALAVAESINSLVGSNLDAPLKNGWVLRDYQKRGVEWLLANIKNHIRRGGILADQMGLGKTLTAAYAAKKLQDRTGCTVFVVAPVSLQKIWARTAEMVELEVEITTNSYQKIFKPLEHKQYLLIADEAHKFQNPKAKCTVSFLELAKHDNCIGVWPLTGTPIKNGRPINLFPLLEAIDHPLARDKRKYEAYYCNAGMKKVNRHRTVWDVSGSSHLQELAANTKDAILQRTKAECLPELPAKTRLFKEAELSAETEREYKDKIASLVADYRDRAKLGLVDPDSEALATINILRGAGSIAKSEYAIELAEDLIDSNEQVVIFTEFLESAKIIAGRLGGLLLTGETKPEERQAMCDRFQAGEVKVIVGTIKAGGVGLTLTAASNVILVDRPWTPGDTEQAEDRCHRLGQQSAVFATWLQHGPIDAAIDGVIQLKQENIDIVMKGKKKTLNNVQSPKELARQLMAIL